MSDKTTLPQIPFNIYDFFGYIIPGAYFSLLASYFFVLIESGSAPGFEKILQNIPDTISGSVLLVLFALLVFYLIGHILAAIGHILVDRIFVKGILGYPYVTILNASAPSQVTYKYIGFSAFMFFIVFIFTSNFCVYISFISFIAFLIVSRVFGAVYFSFNRNNYKSFSSTTLYKVYSLPSLFITPFFDIFKILLNTQNPESEAFCLGIKSKIKEHYKDERLFDSSNVYWLAFFKVAAHNSTFASLINNWLYLYGFARNISFASFVLSFIAISIKVFLPFCCDGLEPINIFIIVCNFIGVVMLLRYWSLYFTYFTKGIFRAFLSIPSVSALSDLDNPNS